MTRRYILHLDVDAFFASVEEILDPSLKGKPLIVGARLEQRGVVASASYAACAFGVRSAMSTAQALRLCPQAIVLPPRHKVYRAYSARMIAILSKYSLLIEPLSLDEAFPSTTLREFILSKVEGLRTRLRTPPRRDGMPGPLGFAGGVGSPWGRVGALAFRADAQRPMPDHREIYKTREGLVILPECTGIWWLTR